MYAWGHCPFGRRICNQALTFNWCLEMLLQYIHIIFPPHDVIYFVKRTSLFCSKAPPQHDAATPVLHGWDGVLRLASLPLVVPWCLYLCTIICTGERGTFRHLEIAPKDEPDLWRSTIFFCFLRSWLISFDFPMMSSRGTEFEGRHWNTSTGTRPIDSNYDN